VKRYFLCLGLLGAAVAAAEDEITAELYDHFVYLAPGEDATTPRHVIHAMEKPGVEVHLLLVWRYGLYALDRQGGLDDAIGGLRLEYASMDKKDAPFLPAPFQADLNPDWSWRPNASGGYFTGARTNKRLERRIIFRLPVRGRYRLRVTGWFNDSAIHRRAPVLAGVAEVRALPEPESLPRDVADNQEPWLPDETDDFDNFIEPPPEPIGEPVAVPTVIGIPVPPCGCAFCGRALGRNCVRINQQRHYHCSHCPGALHVDERGEHHATLLRDGRRQRFEVRDGRAVGFTRPPAPPARVRASIRKRERPPAPRPTRRLRGTAPPAPQLPAWTRTPAPRSRIRTRAVRPVPAPPRVAAPRLAAPELVTPRGIGRSRRVVGTRTNVRADRRRTSRAPAPRGSATRRTAAPRWRAPVRRR
jgi:hypothetical protein